MCQIIYIKNKKGINDLEEEFIKRQYDNNNNDGIGIVYFDKSINKWKWKKFEKDKYNEFIEYYRNLKNDKNITKIAIHLRNATSGETNLINTHPFLISKNRDISLNEGILNDNEILIMENGVSSEIFKIYNFMFNENIDKNKYSDTYTIALTFRKMNLFDIRKIAEKINVLDDTSRFLLISNKKVVFLGEWHNYNDNVLISNYGYYGYYGYYRVDNTKRLNISERIERKIAEKLKLEYSRLFIEYDKIKRKIVYRYGSETKYYKLKKFKKFLKTIIDDEKEYNEIVNELIKEIEEINNKNDKNDYEYYDDYEYRYRYWRRWF